MTKITELTTKNGVRVFRPILRVSRVFYNRDDAEAWLHAARHDVEKAYFAGPPIPTTSPTGHRQTRPNGPRLIRKSRQIRSEL